MHHPNADAPPDGLPRRAAPPGQPPRPFGAPAGAAPTTGGRARAAGYRMPPTMLSGYEQILAARAAMRTEVERAAAVERLGLLAPVLVLAERDPRRARRRAEPRRRPGLILSGLAAAPVCALLALAWIEPPRAPDASPAEPVPVAGTSPPAFDLAAAAIAPAARDPDDAPSWTAGAEPEAPRGSASSEPDPRPEHAAVEPAPPPMGHAGPALAARNQDAPPPAAEAEPAEPPRSEASLSMLGRAEVEETAALAPAVTEAEEESAPAPAAVAEAEEEEPAPAPTAAVEAAETADDGAGAEAVSVAAASNAAGALPLPDTTDADTTGLQGRQEAAPAEARTETKPALPPVKFAAPAQPSPLPPSVRAAPTKDRAGEPPPAPPAPPARTVRAADGASPPAEARCRAIIVKFQLGEETSHADRTYLQTSCGARRR